MDPQHPLPSDGWATTFALGVVRRDDRQQLRPWDHLLHPCEQPLTPRALPLRGKRGVGEGRLIRFDLQFASHGPVL